jgi:hypothetical protein
MLNSDVNLFYFEHCVLCNAIFVIHMCSVDILGTHMVASGFCENPGVTSGIRAVLTVGSQPR